MSDIYEKILLCKKCGFYFDSFIVYQILVIMLVTITSIERRLSKIEIVEKLVKSRPLYVLSRNC
jgi:hypothetical protein